MALKLCYCRTYFDAIVVGINQIIHENEEKIIVIGVVNVNTIFDL